LTITAIILHYNFRVRSKQQEGKRRLSPTMGRSGRCGPYLTTLMLTVYKNSKANIFQPL